MARGMKDAIDGAFAVSASGGKHVVEIGRALCLREGKKHAMSSFHEQCAVRFRPSFLTGIQTPHSHALALCVPDLSSRSFAPFLRVALAEMSHSKQERDTVGMTFAHLLTSPPQANATPP